MRARVRGADGDVVEQAEPLGVVGFGMMAGRADGAERRGRLARKHRIDGGNHRARRVQRRIAGPRRQRGVGVDLHQPRLGHRVKHRAQPVRPLGMARAHIVFERTRV